MTQYHSTLETIFNRSFWFRKAVGIKKKKFKTVSTRYISGILPIGWLQSTYHLFPEPEESIALSVAVIPEEEKATSAIQLMESTCICM